MTITGFIRLCLLAALLILCSAARAQPASARDGVSAVSPAVTALAREERVRNAVILAAAVILAVTLTALILLLIKRGRDYAAPPEDAAGEAYLVDAAGAGRHRLGRKATMLGRVAGKDSLLDYIVVPESTIGRRHAVIEYKDYAWWIADQGSINGTYVNGVPINSEIRLKHGDRIRLHKHEFDFIVPEMEDAGMTQISNTVFAGSGGELELDAEAVRSSFAGGDAAALDLDFSPTQTGAAGQRGDDETLLPDHDLPGGADHQTGDDETLMPDFQSGAAQPAAGGGDPAPAGPDGEDETLLPGRFDDDVDDDTIRPESNGRSAGIFNVTGSDDEDR